ncbi:probable serine/threonine-protein kinase At1g54610 [Sesamum indicum]|uniref:Probable serine/threonine-protein kinase At1g54610 n=1 Tax=Sesamum indicum TaxID=4182 RepID=A0A6I9UIN5_SESIN|nr:probable serine/threonine-protein kinase At1g54610 [Sesamum indicum]
MGCVSSKKARSQSPAFDDVSSCSASAGRSSRPGRLASSGSVHVQAALGSLEKIKEEPEREKDVEDVDEELRKNGLNVDDNLGDLRAGKRSTSQKKSVFSIKFGRPAEGEHVTAGWPAWLTAVAGEAIEGWEPLKSDAFERLEKIGQGTYSTVYRARELNTGKMVAVKKVRFDNFQPESVRFMAREILILRKLDHPNIMKLQGIITSRLSCSIYLVFDYMEHDLAGLLSCPDIKFTDSQIKCYMQQLLSAVEHCHSRGIMHRDIKSSNILVNNEGILKIADFGLANFTRPKNKQPLTSRVVTLWYRPPELLLGSTNYAESVDLWSVGCVFAELFMGRPLLKARTEVEQLHKIFKLCGSPPDDYWKRSKLPLAAMFKPQQPYESTLRERCKEFPKSAVSLIETFLSVEPHKRGTAASALESEYFTTKPYACDPSSLPKYPPNKEIDAKIREDAKRKKSSAITRAEGGPRNPRRARKTLQESTDFCKVIPAEEVDNAQVARRNHGVSTNAYRKKGGVETRTSLKPSYDTKSDASQGSQTTQVSQGTSIHSLPAQVTTSNSFAWAKRRKQPDVFTRLHSQPTQSSNQKSIALEPSNILHVHDTLEPDGQQNHDYSGRISGAETARRPTRREQAQLRRPESFDSSDIYEPQELPEDYGNKKKCRVGYSGTLTSQEIAARQHDLPRQVHRSRFYID